MILKTQFNIYSETDLKLFLNRKLNILIINPRILLIYSTVPRLLCGTAPHLETRICTTLPPVKSVIVNSGAATSRQVVIDDTRLFARQAVYTTLLLYILPDKELLQFRLLPIIYYNTVHLITKCTKFNHPEIAIYIYIYIFTKF